MGGHPTKGCGTSVQIRDGSLSSLVTHWKASPLQRFALQRKPTAPTDVDVQGDQETVTNTCAQIPILKVTERGGVVISFISTRSKRTYISTRQGPRVVSGYLRGGGGYSWADPMKWNGQEANVMWVEKLGALRSRHEKDTGCPASGTIW